jgi:hypothetical protein
LVSRQHIDEPTSAASINSQALSASIEQYCWAKDCLNIAETGSITVLNGVAMINRDDPRVHEFEIFLCARHEEHIFTTMMEDVEVPYSSCDIESDEDDSDDENFNTPAGAVGWQFGFLPQFFKVDHRSIFTYEATECEIAKTKFRRLTRIIAGVTLGCSEPSLDCSSPSRSISPSSSHVVASPKFHSPHFHASATNHSSTSFAFIQPTVLNPVPAPVPAPRISPAQITAPRAVEAPDQNPVPAPVPGISCPVRGQVEEDKFPIKRRFSQPGSIDMDSCSKRRR